MRKKDTLPAIGKTDPSTIMGTGIALTVDENYKEFLGPGILES